MSEEQTPAQVAYGAAVEAGTVTPEQWDVIVADDPDLAFRMCEQAGGKIAAELRAAAEQGKLRFDENGWAKVVE